MSELAHNRLYAKPVGDAGSSRPLPRVRVNDTLSRGLATRALAVLGAQGARYRAGLLDVIRPRVCNKKAITRATHEFTQLGERTKLIQVIGATPNQRQITVCQFVPDVLAGDGQRRPALRVVLHQFMITRRGIQAGPDFGVALIATDHAVERLFLRLNTMDLGAVVAELHDAMLLALPLWAVGLPLCLRQVALPTSSGTFLCDLDPQRSFLCAKTWIPYSTLGPRWAPVATAISSAVAAAGGPASVAATLSVGVAQSLDDEDNALFGQLGDALASYPWLRETYAPRSDPLKDAWKAHSGAQCSTSN